MKTLITLLKELLGAIAVVLLVVICIFASVVALVVTIAVSAVLVPIGSYLLASSLLKTHTAE